jgi:hypothetical protein
LDDPSAGLVGARRFDVAILLSVDILVSVCVEFTCPPEVDVFAVPSSSAADILPERTHEHVQAMINISMRAKIIILTFLVFYPVIGKNRDGHEQFLTKKI